MEADSVLKVEDVAKDLDVAESTVYGLMKLKSDPLPHIKLTTKCIRIPSEDYREWLRRRVKK